MLAQGCSQKFARTITSDGDMAAVSLVWEACCKLLDEGDCTGLLDGKEKPIDPVRKKSLDDKWEDRHKFVFTSRHVLALTLQNKIYAHAQAKRFVILLPEELRLLASITKKEQHSLTVKAGEDIKWESQDLDPCTSHNVFFKRIIAMFNTWALMCVENPAWFSLQDVRDFSDFFEDLFFRRVQGDRPPLEWSFKAYLKMMQLFLDQINTHGKSLHDIMDATYKWETIWTAWTPTPKRTAQTDKGDEPTGTPTICTLAPSVEDRMVRNLHAMTKSLLKENKGNGKNKPFQYGKGSHGGKSKGKGFGKGKGKQGSGGKFGKGKGDNKKPWGVKDGGKWQKQQPWKKKSW